MAAKSGGWDRFGVLANGESRGRNLGLGLCRVFFSGTRTYLKKKRILLSRILQCSITRLKTLNEVFIETFNEFIDPTRH